MLDPSNLPPVEDCEAVTRFLMFSKWIRADNTIKSDAFVPPPDLEFSVTRLRDATDLELWTVGNAVATASNRNLHGRADLQVKAFIDQQLRVQAAPDPQNPNHAIATDWPDQHDKQMLIAKKLAATPGLVRIPLPESASGS